MDFKTLAPALLQTCQKVLETATSAEAQEQLKHKMERLQRVIATKTTPQARPLPNPSSPAVELPPPNLFRPMEPAIVAPPPSFDGGDDEDMGVALENQNDMYDGNGMKLLERCCDD